MKFSSNKIESINNEMLAIIKNIQDNLEEVTMIKNTLATHTSWVGPGSDYYVGQLNKIANQFSDIISSLKNNTDYLIKIKEGYSKLNTKIARQAKEVFE